MEDTAALVEGEQVNTEEHGEKCAAREKENEESDGESTGDKVDIQEARIAGEEASVEKPHRGKTLEQMMSLKEGDDERTQISKKVSWILRHGARKVSIEIDIDGWVNIADILGASIMAGVTEEKLMDIIDESNKQKVRYELKGADGDRAIRAVSKHTISGMTSTLAREQRRADREQRRELRQELKEARERGDVPEDENDPGDQVDDGESRRWTEDGPTFEQQLEDGYRPVYQANRVVAMVKEGVSHAVKPGRRTRPEYKGDYGDYKGDYRGKGDSKGFGKDYGKDWNNDSYGSNAYYRGGGYGGYNGGRGDDDRDYRGSKGSKDGRKGYQDRGDDRREYGRFSGKGYGNEDSSYGRARWRVCPGQEAIMRASSEMESQAMRTLPAGTLVTQTGEPVTNEHGIIRMPIETVDDRVRGWVTRTAEAANGPAFFRREGSDKGSGKGYDSGGYGGKDSGGYSGGYGKGKNSRGGKNSGRGYYDGGSKGSKGRFDDYGHFSMGGRN